MEQEEGGFMKLDDNMIIASIKAEQSKYEPGISVDEAYEMQMAHYKAIGFEPLTIDQVNLYINEVRNG
mgnify:CR=1 FL=1